MRIELMEGKSGPLHAKVSACAMNSCTGGATCVEAPSIRCGLGKSRCEPILPGAVSKAKVRLRFIGLSKSFLVGLHSFYKGKCGLVI